LQFVIFFHEAKLSIDAKLTYPSAYTTEHLGENL